MKKMVILLIILTASMAVQGYAGIADGLTNLWTFNETSGSTAVARFGSADWTNLYQNGWDVGKFDNALTGSGNMVGYADSIPELVGLEQMTVSIWIYPIRSQCDFWANVISHRDANTNHDFFITGIHTGPNNGNGTPAGFVDWDFRICGSSMATTNKTDTSVKLVDQAWNHMVLTWTYGLSNPRDALNMWINGVKVDKDDATKVGSGTYWNYVKPGNWRWVLGQDRETSNRRFGGRLDEIAIWNRILSDKEIAALYNAGAGNQLDPVNVEVTEGSSTSFDLTVAPEPAAFPATILVNSLDPNAVDPDDPEYDFAIDDPNFAVTSTTWNQVHPVTITPVDDDIRELDKTYLLSTSSLDATAYTSPLLVDVTIIDNDVPKIVINPVDPIDENGGSATLTISMTGALKGSESVTLDLSADPAFLSLTPSQVVFNASSPVSVDVTLNAVDNSDIDNGTVPYSSYMTTVSIATTKVDLPKTPDAPNVDVTILEDDCGAMGMDPLDANQDCVIDLTDALAMLSNWLVCDLPNRALGECN